MLGHLQGLLGGNEGATGVAHSLSLQQSSLADGTPQAYYLYTEYGMLFGLSYISRIGEIRKLKFSDIFRIIENIGDLNFQYFQDRNNQFSIVVRMISFLGLNYQKIRLNIFKFH